MFWKTLKMEIVRACRLSRILLIMGLIVALLVGSDWEFLRNAILYGYEEDVGSIEKIMLILVVDTFKCVMVVLLAGLYTNSFCKDDNSRYLRMILNRTDITTYTQCRFLANLLVIVLTAIGSFYLYVLVMRPVIPLWPKSGTHSYYYYIDIAENYPLLYVAMMGLVFGLVAAACSSVGLLYSSYSSNSFVSIGLSGMVFFWAISYIPYGNPFNIINIVCMGSTLGDVPWPLMFLWTIFYMLSVIGICGVLFYRRMKWRMENGYL